MASGSGSLFGGSSLFGGGTTGAGAGAGGAGTSAPQTGSIFSSTNQPSVFGNTATTTATTATGQTAPTLGLFGQQPQQQQPAQTQGLGLGLGQSQQTTAGAQTLTSAQATQPAFFNSLLERGKKRPLSTAGQNAGFGELPSLQLGLDDIRRKARELGAGGAKVAQQKGLDSKA